MKQFLRWLFGVDEMDGPTWCLDCDGDIDPDPSCPTCRGSGEIGEFERLEQEVANNTWRGR